MDSLLRFSVFIFLSIATPLLAKDLRVRQLSKSLDGSLELELQTSSFSKSFQIALNPNQKTLLKRIMGSRAHYRAGILQTREINIEISLWNREEERADEDGTSGDGGKYWRISFQRKGLWNG
ncbi:MAG: hypothetical protein EZS28_004756 [Streblomastix strix]|uniref:Uncharacterized protein n=1 Tax=Streblomastix strix TaxID=222440 RepID=A0A5J4WXC2_9EUKA|nr:MAG: hypothetical protein EZS28_004756 [Streblomastix strix]